MDKKEIKEKIGQGWVRINMIFEMVGNPKKHVEETLKSYMTNMRTDSDIVIMEEEYGEADEIEKGLYSTYVEADMLINGLEKVNWLCLNFTPASVEIIEPLEFKIGAESFQNWINDLLSRLHEVGTLSKQISSQNKLFVNNMNRLIKNSIMLCVGLGINTRKEIAKKVGIPEKQLEPFFDALLQEGNLQGKQGKLEKKEETKPKKKTKKK